MATIISIILNGLAISVICVACDFVLTPILVRCQSCITRTDVARILCFLVPVGAFIARGVAGLFDISPLAVVGPTYICLTGTTTVPISVKGLLSAIWDNTKRILGIK